LEHRDTRAGDGFHMSVNAESNFQREAMSHESRAKNLRPMDFHLGLVSHAGL
jgi:hypothetical protein